MLAANRVCHPAHNEGVWQLEETLLMQLGETDDAPLSPWVAFVNDEGELIGAKPLVAQIGRVSCYEAEANVHSAFFQGCLNVCGGDFLNGKADPGMAGGKQAQQMWHECHVEDGNDS